MTSPKVRERIEEGLSELIDKVYTNLSMIQSRVYNDDTVARAFTEDLTDMLSMDSEAEKLIMVCIAAYFGKQHSLSYSESGGIKRI